ncbi:MAG: hypothetical protein LBC73_10910 [Oscillospiraceae bacterium]|jgi:hypothetical protein|nr:hypothetical protein [Oscillospiraceae bacterium]
MIVELICLSLILLGGFAFVYTMGIRGVAAISLGFIMGLAIQVIIGTVLIMINVPYNAVITVGLTFLLPFLLLIYTCIKGITSISFIRLLTYIAVSIAVVTITVTLLFNEGFVKWSYDSMRYLLSSQIMYENRLELLSEDLLTKRMFGVPIIHSPAQIVGEVYLRAVFPLLGIATFTTLMCFIYQGLKKRVSKKTMWFLVFAGGLLLLTNNRFVWNSFYINGHLFCAALALVISGCAWFMVSDDNKSKKRLLAIIIVAIPALVLTRSESILVAALAVLPILAAKILSWKYKSAILLSLGVSAVICHSFILLLLDNGINSLVFSYVLFGILLTFLAILLKFLIKLKVIKFVVTNIVIISELLLWYTLIILSYQNRYIINTTLESIYHNIILGDGAWGWSFVILICLTISVLLLIKRPKNMAILRFPVTTFLPFMFILAHLRESPYRVGFGDSMNRMLIQIVPLAILFIVMSIGLGDFRFTKERCVLYIEKIKKIVYNQIDDA